MLYDTYIRIAGKTKPQRYLIITAVNGAGTGTVSYEFTDMDTGEVFTLSSAQLADADKETIIRRYDSSYTKRQHTVRFIEEDQHEPIVRYLHENGTFPHHLIKKNNP